MKVCGFNYVENVMSYGLLSEIASYLLKKDFWNGNEMVFIDDNIPMIIKKLIPLINIHSDLIVDYNHCTISKYNKNQSVSLRIEDREFGEYVATFSFGSPSQISFSKRHNEVIFKTPPVILNQNSLYILSGEARLTWFYEIFPAPVKCINNQKIKSGNRILITFRTLED